MIPVGVTGVKYLAKLFVKEILAKRLQSSESRGRVIVMINKYLNKAQRIVAGTIGILLGALVLTVIINHSLDKATAYECHGEVAVVDYGDTIWDIVKENCSGHTGHASYETVRLNNNTSNIQVGQTIQLP
tara:strand:+ start:102 stop:491 length:390 start_codon:yes stop_codon:yes gene_type:complete